MFPWKKYKNFCRVLAKELKTETSSVASAISEDVEKDHFTAHEYDSTIILEGNDWKYSDAIPAEINSVISPENKYREIELKWLWVDGEDKICVIIRFGWLAQQFFGQAFFTEPGGETSEVIEMRNDNSVYRYEEDA